MEKLFLFTVLAIATYFLSTIISIVHADTIAISSVTDDSYVDQESSDTNYGSNSNLIVQSRKDGVNYRNDYTFIRFDLSSIPSSATITSATLNLYATSAASSRTYEAQRASSLWTQSTIKWNNQPGVIGIAVTTTTAAGWMSWDVTSDVQAFYSGSNNYGWRIKDSVDNAGGGGETSTFDSSESSNVQNRPYLYITFTPPESCGISVSPSLDFQNMKPGDTSTNQPTIITNTGNSPTDTLLISGIDWSGSDTMLVGQTRWSIDMNQGYDSMTALTSSPTGMNVDVSPDSPLTVYFKLRIPTNQKSGSYSQTITFTSGC